MAPSRPYDGCHGAGDDPPPQRAAGGGARRGKHGGLRAQNRPLPGMRPAPLAEVAGPQEGALVSSPMLAGGDATDDVTVAFLVAAALEEKKDEEEKARVRRQREAAGGARGTHAGARPTSPMTCRSRPPNPVLG